MGRRNVKRATRAEVPWLIPVGSDGRWGTDGVRGGESPTCTPRRRTGLAAGPSAREPTPTTTHARRRVTFARHPRPTVTLTLVTPSALFHHTQHTSSK